MSNRQAEKLPNPKKKMVVFTTEPGGEAHCQVNNLALPNTSMFDWLDEVLINEERKSL